MSPNSPQAPEEADDISGTEWEPIAIVINGLSGRVSRLETALSGLDQGLDRLEASKKRKLHRKSVKS